MDARLAQATSPQPSPAQSALMVLPHDNSNTHGPLTPEKLHSFYILQEVKDTTMVRSDRESRQAAWTQLRNCDFIMQKFEQLTMHSWNCERCETENQRANKQCMKCGWTPPIRINIRFEPSAMGITWSTTSPKGAIVLKVKPASQADKLGIQRGWIAVGVNQEKGDGRGVIRMINNSKNEKQPFVVNFEQKQEDDDAASKKRQRRYTTAVTLTSDPLLPPPLSHPAFNTVKEDLDEAIEKKKRQLADMDKKISIKRELVNNLNETVTAKEIDKRKLDNDIAAQQALLAQLRNSVKAEQVRLNKIGEKIYRKKHGQADMHTSDDESDSSVESDVDMSGHSSPPGTGRPVGHRSGMS